MSAVELNVEVLERLGNGDAIFAAEAAKRTALAIGEAINASSGEEGTPDERLERLLERSGSSAEELLGALFPLIEYGDGRSLGVIPRCLLHIAEQTTAADRDNQRNQVGGVVVVGRIVWAATAYALHCGRLDAVAASSRALVRVPSNDNQTVPLIALMSLRYPEALGGHAGRSFDDYREWISSLDLVLERYPLFAAELDTAFAEADMVLALRAALKRGRVYSRGLDAETVRRFALRARDAQHRGSLAEAFATTVDELEQVLEQAYGRVETDPNQWDGPPTTLFGGDSP